MLFFEIVVEQQNVGFTRRGIVKEGFLWKMAKADPSWTRLWCICKPEALFFFRPQQVPPWPSKALESVSLFSDISVVTS